MRFYYIARFCVCLVCLVSGAARRLVSGRPAYAQHAAGHAGYLKRMPERRAPGQRASSIERVHRAITVVDVVLFAIVDS